MNLIDTSGFVDFFRKKPAAEFIGNLIEENQVVLHPYVEAELVLGGLNPFIENLLSALPTAAVIDYPVAMQFIRKYKLIGLGLGLVDCQILASAKADAHKLITFDKALHKAAAALNLC